jgi:antirestriction protein
MSDFTTPSIYVACLAAYNSGILHGRWIDATQSEEDIRAEIADILKSSPISEAEEWAIHDHEGFGDGLICEYTDINEVAAYAEIIVEHPEFGAAVLNHCEGYIEEARNALEGYRGQFESLADYVQDLTEESTQIPAHLDGYIDYEAIARDMELNGEVFTIETGPREVHVFEGH